ncbi:hypothetical protein CJD36_022175 [Flavipsychrobacter stenotrophus]|uniref:Uncharacterized protein n=1 Tax=Flavipsychrobacter stenotrophus TaxID=2077091 RepID=A0A2S7SQ23_9BACT|nr:hypothetical protein CJD36_022175 [Flavipsychrobacter stenotrophus]
MRFSINQIFIVILLLCSTGAIGQYGSYYPLTRDTFNHFKDSLVIVGKIVKYSGLHPQCGTRCSSEHLIVDLSEKNPKYPYLLIYIAFTCFDLIDEKELFKTIRMKIEKIELNDDACFWSSSSFDSKGLPFYDLISHSVVK